MEEKDWKDLLIFKIIEFESGTTSSHNPELDICQWKSMRYERPLRIKQICKGDIFQMKVSQSDEKT